MVLKIVYLVQTTYLVWLKNQNLDIFGRLQMQDSILFRQTANFAWNRSLFLKNKMEFNQIKIRKNHLRSLKIVI